MDYGETKKCAQHNEKTPNKKCKGKFYMLGKTINYHIIEIKFTTHLKQNFVNK